MASLLWSQGDDRSRNTMSLLDAAALGAFEPSPSSASISGGIPAARGPQRRADRLLGRLLADPPRVADPADNRVLGFRPENSADARLVPGQPDFDAGGENRWSAVGPDTLCWPYGLARDGDRLAIADSGNNRVVVWRVPALSDPAPGASSALARP